MAANSPGLDVLIGGILATPSRCLWIPLRHIEKLSQKTARTRQPVKGHRYDMCRASLIKFAPARRTLGGARGQQPVNLSNTRYERNQHHLCCRRRGGRAGLSVIRSQAHEPTSSLDGCIRSDWDLSGDGWGGGHVRTRCLKACNMVLVGSYDKTRRCQDVVEGEQGGRMANCSPRKRVSGGAGNGGFER